MDELQNEMQRFDRAQVIESEQRLANKLDRLSAPLAERVLQEAIELHQQDMFDDTSVGWEDLERMGLELGIDKSTLRRALMSALETESDQPSSGLFEKLFGPSEISGGVVATGDADAVYERLEDWMHDLEGMAATRSEGSTTAWEARSGTAGNPGLHDFGPILTRLTDIAKGDQLLEMTVTTKRVRNEALGLLGAFAFFGVSMGVFLAGLGTNAPDFLPGFLEFFLPFGGAMLLGLSTTMAMARARIKSIRSGINRALGSIANLTKRGRPRRGRSKDSTTWREIIDET